MNLRKRIYQFYYYSNIIVNRVFRVYLVLIVAYHFFISKEIPIYLSYLFFLLLGIYLGYKLARCAYDYLKANQGKID